MQKILISTAHGLVKSIATSILRVTSVRLTTLISLILATLLLAACGGGGGGSSSGGGGPQVYQVSSATVVGGFRNVTINWLNPAVGAGNVTAVNITYQVVAVNGPANDKTTLLLSEPRHLISDGTAVITHTINPFEPALYTFTIEPVLGGALINATTRAVVVPNVNVIVNPDDLDGDGVLNAVDVDEDGDGLIELRTAEQLNMMRYSLDGSGLDDGTSDNDNTTGGNSDGCGGGFHSNGTTITTCNGYEQMADIDLNDLGRDASGSNWEPVGTFITLEGNCQNDAGSQFFSGIFSGNDFTISNLLINITTNSCGAGFFGAFFDNAQVRNTHIRGGNITADTGVTSNNVGGLVGYVNVATIRHSSVTLGAINGTDQVGGLAGNGGAATISSSVATVGSISGARIVGGLTGHGGTATISSSVAIVGAISATGSNIGGLAGFGWLARISHSSVTLGAISGADTVGGLLGSGVNAIISSSVAITNSITGSSDVGGLVGAGTPTSVTASYWDDSVTLMPATGNTVGSGQSTTALQTPTTFGGIYATWSNAWCNPTTGEFITDSSSTLAIDVNRVWDLGIGTQYPAITCAQSLFSLADQREASRRALAGELPLVD